MVPRLGASEGLASLPRRCPESRSHTQCGGLRTPLPRSLQGQSGTPTTTYPGRRCREKTAPRRAAGSTQLRQGAELYRTEPAALRDPRAAVPPTALLLTNETGPRPPRSADLTSGPAPAVLQCLSLQLSATAWSWEKPSLGMLTISVLVELEEVKLRMGPLPC